MLEKYFNNYKQFITKYVEFDEGTLQMMAKSVKLVHYKKNEIIHSQDEVCHRMLFICRGVARSYLLDEEGNDRTWKIFFNDENAKMVNLYAVDYDSFVHNSPSLINIEATQDCDFLSFKRESVLQGYLHLNSMNTFGRLMAEQAYLYEHHHHINHTTQSAEQRLLNLLETEPYLLDKVPQYHIASLLNITPQHLSRLKKIKNI